VEPTRLFNDFERTPAVVFVYGKGNEYAISAVQCNRL